MLGSPTLSFRARGLLKVEHERLLPMWSYRARDFLKAGCERLPCRVLVTTKLVIKTVIQRLSHCLQDVNMSLHSDCLGKNQKSGSVYVAYNG